MRKAKFSDPNNLCVYCGERPATSRDHVIGKQFFPKDQRDGLPLVASCDACNSAMSQHEDYVRLLVVGACDHPMVEQMRQTELASALKIDLGLRKLSQRMLHRRPVLLPSGLIMPMCLTMDIYWDRLGIVLDNIVRGLYYLRTNARLPKDCEFHHDKCDSRGRIALAKKIVDGWSAAGLQEVQSPVFTYRFAVSDEDTVVTAWLLSFYDQIHFWVATTPPGFQQRTGTSELNSEPLDHFLAVHSRFRCYLSESK